MAATIKARGGSCWDLSTNTPLRRLSAITIASTRVLFLIRRKPNRAKDQSPKADSVAGFLLLARVLGIAVLAVFIRLRAIIVGADFIIVEIAHQFRGAAFFHDSFQAPPRGLRSLRGAASLRI